jgi:hypothetical protein
MAQYICIYCKSQTNSFNREHVIPEAFGIFELNWSLVDCVCQPCDTEFGNTIEPILSRDSPEALLRLEYGIKSPSKAGELHYNRVTVKVNEPGFWFGARFEFVSDAIGQKMMLFKALRLHGTSSLNALKLLEQSTAL